MTRSDPDDGLRAIIRAGLPRVHWNSIETGGTMSGAPDMEGCLGGRAFWVECKATRAWSVGLDPFQIGWHLRRARAGGLSFVAVRRRHEGGRRLGPPVDELWLWRGADVEVLAEDGLRTKRARPLLVLEGGPRLWNWKSFLDQITA